MRKLLIGLLAIGLVFAFVGPSFATDVSFSGAFRVRGFSFDNGGSAIKDDPAGNATNQYYDQRFRVTAKFAVADGIGLVTRGDIIDNKTWGDPAGDPAEEMNFDKAYGWFNTGIGTFLLGKNSDNQYGTKFGDEEVFKEYMQYAGSFGPMDILLRVVKNQENDKGAANADLDEDYYKAAATYNWEGGQAGVFIAYVRDASNRTLAAPYESKWWVIDPMIKATFGPVYFEAEAIWNLGTEKEFENGGADEDYDGVAYYAQAKMDIGPANVGVMYAFASGDDPTTADNEAAYTGSDWNPSVVLFNDQGMGHCAGDTFGVVDGDNTGTQVFQIFAGISPIEKLTTRIALSKWYVDEQNAGGAHADDDLGTTVDIEATYKIFDSVYYYIGFGYLWAGDYWKGAAGSGIETEDTYTLMHKIQWNF